MPTLTRSNPTFLLSRTALFAIPSLLLIAIACSSIDGVNSDEPIENRDDTFQVSGEVVVDVDSFNGAIDVTASESTTVRVIATITRADKVDYEATQFGSDIQIKASQTGSTSGRSPSVKLEITAPPASQLVLRTSNGAIDISGFNAGATIRTSNGRITVNGMSGELDADTSNGAINVSNFTGSADLETSNGAIRFTGELVAGSDNDMITSKGSLTIDLNPDASIVFDGASSNGSVTSEFPILATSTGKNHLEGTIGDGAAELTARTSNGSITVE